jgi:hypothetical protein
MSSQDSDAPQYSQDSQQSQPIIYLPLDIPTDTEDESQDVPMDVLDPEKFRARVISLWPHLEQVCKGNEARLDSIQLLVNDLVAVLNEVKALQEDWDKHPVNTEDQLLVNLWGIPQDYLDTCIEMSEDVLDATFDALLRLGSDQ